MDEGLRLVSAQASFFSGGQQANTDPAEIGYNKCNLK
jgi:hypothetical protein